MQGFKKVHWKLEEKLITQSPHPTMQKLPEMNKFEKP